MRRAAADSRRTTGEPKTSPSVPVCTWTTLSARTPGPKPQESYSRTALLSLKAKSQRKCQKVTMEMRKSGKGWVCKCCGYAIPAMKELRPNTSPHQRENIVLTNEIGNRILGFLINACSMVKNRFEVNDF